MPTERTFRRHAALVDHMADAQGLDLEELVLRGKLPVPELEDAVLRCTGCTQPCACESWLDSLNGAKADAPSYCRNGELFEALKRG